MKPIATLLFSNKKWLESIDRKFLEDNAQRQSPDVLFIACSDSRVTPSEITQSRLGELFETRNVANQVNPEDISVCAVVRYAVTHLKVKHIVVCGHDGCGGVDAAIQIVDNNIKLEPELMKWTKPIRQVYTDNLATLSKITDPVEKAARLTRLNVKAQVDNLKKLAPVIEAKAAGHGPALHSAVFTIDSGKLQLLDTDDESCLHNAIIDDVVKLEIMRLDEYAQAVFNPYKFLGAAQKKQAIQDALDHLNQSGTDIKTALKDTNSELYQALNMKRLTPFTLFGNHQLFSTEAKSLTHAKEGKDEIEVGIAERCCTCH